MYKSKKKSKNKKHSQVGIKWKMLAIILIFILLFTLAMWIFQIQMLNYFYQVVKFRELDSTLTEVENVKNDRKQITHVLRDRAEDTYDDIWIYKVSDGYIDEKDPFVFFRGSHDSSVIFLRSNFYSLYLDAKNNSNHYIGIFSMEDFNADNLYEFKILDENKGDPNRVPYVSRDVSGMNAIRIDIIYADDGTELLVVQRTNLEPMSALVNTVKTQVVFVSTVLIIFAFVLVIVMSRFITIPIIRINDSAK